MRASRLVKAVAVAGFALLLNACGSFPINPPLPKHDPSAGYRFEKLDAGANSDELFVILVFSGGGTRAAAFSYGVLEALRDTRIELNQKTMSLLDEVDVISSVSGGSFPAAYYALSGARTFDEFPDRFLYQPVQSSLLKNLFSPVNLLKLAGSSFGRSDLAAEYYDREVFGGATYAHLIAQRRRPFLILNATDMTTGAQFSFTQDQFDLLCSDLAGVTLGRAVAASSAFPGGLTPLTFANYAGSCNYRQPRWVELALKDRQSRANVRRTARADRRLSYTDTENPRAYIHLTDGGVADNIGLREPLTAISELDNAWSVLRLINLRQVNKLVVIVVNAATNPVTRRDQSASVPGLIDSLSAAANIPLDNYSFETLQALTAIVNEFNEEARLISGCEALAAEKGRECALDIQAPHRIDFFPIQVAFEFVASDEERRELKNLPTNFQLPRETVDKLRSIGRRVLSEDPQFKRLMGALQGCLATESPRC